MRIDEYLCSRPGAGRRSGVPLLLVLLFFALPVVGAVESGDSPRKTIRIHTWHDSQGTVVARAIGLHGLTPDCAVDRVALEMVGGERWLLTSNSHPAIGLDEQTIELMGSSWHAHLQVRSRLRLPGLYEIPMGKIAGVMAAEIDALYAEGGSLEPRAHLEVGSVAMATLLPDADDLQVDALIDQLRARSLFEPAMEELPRTVARDLPLVRALCGDSLGLCVNEQLLKLLQRALARHGVETEPMVHGALQKEFAVPRPLTTLDADERSFLERFPSLDLDAPFEASCLTTSVSRDPETAKSPASAPGGGR